jgi:hypothetical protein
VSRTRRIDTTTSDQTDRAVVVDAVISGAIAACPTV